MNKPSRLATVVLALGALAASAAAQPAHGNASSSASSTASPSADPTQAQAPVPALAYRSALQAYRPWREQAPGNWRALNDEVTRIGGWRSYLREVNQAPEAAAAPAASTGLTPTLAAPAATPTGAVPAPPALPAPTPRPKGQHHGHH